MRPDPRPIGILDSGIGGLSVLREVRAALPTQDLLYVADQCHVPYGPRPADELRRFADSITRFLLAHDGKLVVVACNAASAAALKTLRATFPALPFVGMEPAVKPAAEQSATGVIGVLATPATFQGELYSSLIERFGKGVTVLQQVCPGLVERIEAGEHDTPETAQALQGWLEPLLAQRIDVLVLGCTHYPFVQPTLERLCGPRVRIIDPSPAIARRVRHVLAERGLSAATDYVGRIRYFTSGPVPAFAHQLDQLGLPSGSIVALHWDGAALADAESVSQ